MSKFNLLVKETTEQELFDHVVKHLAKQKVKSANSSNRCLYRAGELSCAVGACFSDHYYDEEMDTGFRAELLINKFFPEAKHLITLSRKLQVYHDRPSHGADNLQRDLKGLAREHDLDYSLVETITEWES